MLKKFNQLSLRSKIASGFLFLLLTCCVCGQFLPAPDEEPAAEQAAVAQVAQATAIESDEPEPPLAPTGQATELPEPDATEAPTEEPSATANQQEAATATQEPTPTDLPPTAAPTTPPLPTATTVPPTAVPTSPPAPTAEPTNAPAPTVAPTTPPVPTAEPTNAPAPTAAPTNAPAPTAEPTSPPAPSGAAVSIVTVNKSEEYVDIRNNSGGDIDLNGWELVSETGNQRCALGGVIGAGQTLRIWAMSEDAGQGGFNCGFGGPIWNNSESDPAALFDAQDNLVDRR